jgi:hypothetical protein
MVTSARRASEGQGSPGGTAVWSGAAPFLVAAGALALIGRTVMPGVGFWDTAEFQTVGPILGTAHPTGFPAYVILGWIASNLLAAAGEPAFRMNVLSALLVAAAAGVCVVLVRKLTRSTLLGVAAGLALAATPIVWALGRHADPHALHLLLVAVLLALLVGWEQAVRSRVGNPPRAGAIPDRSDGGARIEGRGDRWLVAAAFVFGIAVANHSLSLLLIAPVGLYVLAVQPGMFRRPRLVATCAVVLVATTAILYLELPLRSGPFRAPLVYAAPNTLSGFAYIVLAEQFRGSIVDPFGDLPGKFRTLVDLVVLEFGLLAALLPVAFAATVVRRPRYALLTGLAALVTCFFAASYQNADISRYYVGPALMAWSWLAILAGTAVELVGARSRGRRTDADGDGAPGSQARWAAHRPARAAVMTALIAAGALIAPTVAAIPGRAATLDESHDTAAQRWVDAALGAMEPRAVVISWWSYSTPLWYAQRVEGRRPDISIIDDRTRLDEQLGEVTTVIEQHLGHEPVYVIRNDDAELETIRSQYRLEAVATEASNLYRVAGRVTAAR